MAYPTTYTVSYSFTGWQAANPTKPLPASRVAIELSDIATAIFSTQSALADVRRSDGALVNGLVTLDALADSLKVPWTGGAVSAWAPVVAYAAGIAAQSVAPATVVTYLGETWLCTTAHTTASTFDPSLWTKLAAKGAVGAGSGDMLSANNLSDVANAATARGNLGAAARVRPTSAVSTSTSLTAAAVGSTIVVTSSGVTISLPSAVATAGDVTFCAASGFTLSSPVAGSLVGAGYSATSISVPAGETVSVESDGSNWRVTNRTEARGLVAIDVLAALLTVDGSGSGLDADKLRGVTPSTFGLSRLADADAAAARTALGLGAAATVFSSLRNRHLNSAMQICQDRATGATVVLSVGGYAFDGISMAVTGGGTLTCSQAVKVTPGGSPYRFRAAVSTADTSLAASDVYLVEFPVEGVDVADLMFGTSSAKNFVWRGVVNLPAGTYGLSFRSEASTRSYVTTFTVSAGEAGTDKLITAIVPGDTAGTWVNDASGIGISARIAFASGTTYQTATTGAWQTGNYVTTAAQTNAMASTSNVFEVADIGLYAGTELPAWEMPTMADDTLRCHRQACIVSMYIPATNSIPVTFPTTMRAAPSAALISGSLGSINQMTASTANFNNVGGYANVVTALFSARL